MNVEINNVVERVASSFIDEVVEKMSSSSFLSLKKNVQIETLKELWQNAKNNPKPLNLVQTPLPTVPEKKKKKSAYQNFFIEARKQITQTEPQIKFGELSSNL